MSEGLVEGPGDASVQEEGMEYGALAGENHERERERERERPPKAALQTATGRRTGGVPGGGPGGVKGTGGFSQKSPYLMQFLRVFWFSGSDSVAPRLKVPKTLLPRKGFAKHIKTEWPKLQL